MKSFFVAAVVLLSSSSFAGDNDIPETNRFTMLGNSCIQIWKKGGQRAEAICPVGTAVLSGGCKTYTVKDEQDLLHTYPDSVRNSWMCFTSDPKRKVAATAVCCDN